MHDQAHRSVKNLIRISLKMTTKKARVLVDSLFPYKFQNGRVEYTRCERDAGMSTLSYTLKLIREARKYDALLMGRPIARFVGLIGNYLKYKPCKLMMYEFQYPVPEGGFAKQLNHEFLKRGVRGLDYVIVHCEFETDWYPELFGTKNTKFIPILYGITPLSYIGPAAEGHVFSAGVDRDFKTLIQAFDHLSIPCTVVGPKNEPDLSGISNPNISLYQSVPKEQYLDLLRSSRFVVMTFKPRQKMCVGCVSVLEALCIGKPLIVTNFPGISEYIQTDGCVPVPPNDSEALAAAIQKLYDTPYERLVEMGKAAHKHVRDNFENQHFQIRFEQEILKAVGIED